jgi:hypothetical protein
MPFKNSILSKKRRSQFYVFGDQTCLLNFAHLWQNWSTDSSHSERMERLYMEKAGSPVTALFTLSHIHLLQHLFTNRSEVILHYTENSKLMFPEMKLLGPGSGNFYIHVSVSDLYIPTISPPILLFCVCGPICGSI